LKLLGLRRGLHVRGWLLIRWKVLLLMIRRWWRPVRRLVESSWRRPPKLLGRGRPRLHERRSLGWLPVVRGKVLVLCWIERLGVHPVRGWILPLWGRRVVWWWLHILSRRLQNNRKE